MKALAIALCLVCSQAFAGYSVCNSCVQQQPYISYSQPVYSTYQAQAYPVLYGVAPWLQSQS